MPVPFGTLAGDDPTPDDLVDAVVGRLRSTLVAAGALTWAGTGLAPPGQDLPYCSVGEPDEDTTYLDTDGSAMADGHLVLTCYADGKKAARLAGDRAARSLQDCPLVFAAGSLVLLRQASRSAELDPDPAPGGGDCWQEARTFHYLYAYQSRPAPAPGGP
jgi:hypothetical protein